MVFLDRRRFGLVSLAALFGGSLPTSCAAQKQAGAAITFGFSLYGMRSLPLETALATCAKLGYDAVELAVMPGWPAEPKALAKDARRRLRERLRTLRLSLPALMENTPLDVADKAHRDQLDRLRGAAELGHELSPDAPPLIETILGGKVGQWDAVRKMFAERLAEWAKLAERAKTVIAIKPHRSGAMNTPEQAVWLLEQVKSPWIRLVYDYSHFEHRELPMAATLKTLLPVTRFVHVKDTKVEKDRVQFLLPGDGQTDYVALFKQLQAASYRGCVCVEVSGMLHTRKDYDPIVAARRSYENLSPAFEKAGVKRR